MNEQEIRQWAFEAAMELTSSPENIQSVIEDAIRIVDFVTDRHIPLAAAAAPNKDFSKQQTVSSADFYKQVAR